MLYNPFEIVTVTLLFFSLAFVKTAAVCAQQLFTILGELSVFLFVFSFFKGFMWRGMTVRIRVISQMYRSHLNCYTLAEMKTQRLQKKCVWWQSLTPVFVLVQCVSCACVRACMRVSVDIRQLLALSTHKLTLHHCRHHVVYKFTLDITIWAAPSSEDENVTYCSFRTTHHVSPLALDTLSLISLSLSLLPGGGACPLCRQLPVNNGRLR